MPIDSHVDTLQHEETCLQSVTTAAASLIADVLRQRFGLTRGAGEGVLLTSGVFVIDRTLCANLSRIK